VKTQLGNRCGNGDTNKSTHLNAFANSFDVAHGWIVLGNKREVSIDQTINVLWIGLKKRF